MTGKTDNKKRVKVSLFSVLITTQNNNVPQISDKVMLSSSLFLHEMCLSTATNFHGKQIFQVSFCESQITMINAKFLDFLDLASRSNKHIFESELWNKCFTWLSRAEMWAGSSRTDVLLGHAALLWRSPSLCCLHSRHLHSLHCCLKSFKTSSLSLRLLLSLSLPPSLSAQTLPLPCCLEMKRSENGDNGGGVSYQRRMKEERDQRGGEGRPAGER